MEGKDLISNVFLVHESTPKKTPEVRILLQCCYCSILFTKFFYSGVFLEQSMKSIDLDSLTIAAYSFGETVCKNQ